MDFEDYKSVVLEGIGTPPISNVNAKLVNEELLDRAREEEWL